MSIYIVKRFPQRKSVARPKTKRSSENKSIDRKRILPFIIITVITLIVTGIVFYAVTTTISFLRVRFNCSYCSESLITKPKNYESTLVVIESPVDDKIVGVWIVLRSVENAKVLVIYIPRWVYISDYSELTSSYLSVSNLKYAGAVVSPGREREYALWQLSNMTGVGITNYVWLNGEFVKSYTNLYSDISEFDKSALETHYTQSVTSESLVLHSLLSKLSLLKPYKDKVEYLKMLSNIDSNMTSAQLFKYTNSLKSILDSSSITMIDLSQSWAVKEQLDTQNSRKVPVIDYNAMDAAIQNDIGDIKLRAFSSELSKIEVYNGSEVSGLGYRYARKLLNNGLDVVRFDNAPTTYDKTTVYISKDSFPISTDIVKNVLGGDVVTIQGRPDFITTGDIIVILGKDQEKFSTWH